MLYSLQVIRHLKRVLPNGPQRKREVDYVLDRISETMTPMHYHSREVIFSTFNLVSEFKPFLFGIKLSLSMNEIHKCEIPNECHVGALCYLEYYLLAFVLIFKMVSTFAGCESYKLVQFQLKLFHCGAVYYYALQFTWQIPFIKSGIVIRQMKALTKCSREGWQCLAKFFFGGGGGVLEGRSGEGEGWMREDFFKKNQECLLVSSKTN